VATEVDLDVDQYAAWSGTVVYCNPIPGSNPPQPDPSNPVNVTGWQATLTIRQSISGRVLMVLTQGAGITVGTTNGQFALAMTGAQTGQLVNGVYDLLAGPTDSTPQRIAQGHVNVSPGVSRALV
jgi:hypothetical protein